MDKSNIEVCISDHELHANGDIWNKNTTPPSAPDAHGCLHSKRQILGHRKLFPVAAWGDATPTPMVHRGYYLDLAPHVRLVVSDLRSPERNESADRDVPAKQMWGATQEQWLYETAFDVAPNVTILFVNETVWWRRGGDVTDDKPASYPDAQRIFMERLTGTGAYAGYRSIIDRFIWLGGDRHYCGHLKRSDADLRDNFPQFIGSGFLKNSLYPHPQENMSWRTPVRSDPDAWFPVCGYMKLRLTYTATTRKVKLTGIARIVPKTHREVTDGKLTKDSTLVQSPNDARFTLADEGKIITGKGVPDLLEGQDEIADEGPTRIATYINATSVNMDKPAKASGDPVLLSIADKAADWPAVVDYPPPPGGPGTVEIQV